jgi:hypothetical protein
MTSVWKTKVLPGLSKIFDKDGKKAAAVEFLKTFNKVWVEELLLSLCSIYVFVCSFADCMGVLCIYVGGYQQGD